MGNKICKITKSFDRVVQLKNWEVTYWAERNRLAVVYGANHLVTATCVMADFLADFLLHGK